MRTYLNPALKQYFRDALLQSRGDTMTQEQMAAKLGMSTRSYQDLEAGKRCFGIFTFCMFLLYGCSDRNAFLNGLVDLLDALEQQYRKESA